MPAMRRAAIEAPPRGSSSPIRRAWRREDGSVGPECVIQTRAADRGEATPDRPGRRARVQPSRAWRTQAGTSRSPGENRSRALQDRRLRHPPLDAGAGDGPSAPPPTARPRGDNSRRPRCTQFVRTRQAVLGGRADGAWRGIIRTLLRHRHRGRAPLAHAHGRKRSPRDHSAGSNSMSVNAPSNRPVNRTR